MGLLDELNNKVEELELQKLKRDSELEAQDRFYKEQLRPAMLEALEYLSDVVRKLNIVAPRIKPEYPLNPTGEQRVLLDQRDYRIDFDCRENPGLIDIYCSCLLERPQTYFVSARDASLAYADLLHDYGFPFQQKNHLDKRFDIRGTTFFLEGPMPVHIQIRANKDGGCIQVFLRNLEAQPSKRYRFSPGQFNRELTERLARLLVREEQVLATTTVSDDYRARLRAQIETERQQKALDMSAALADIESEKSAELNARPGKRARKIVAARLEAALGFRR